MYILLKKLIFFTMDVLLKTNNMKISEVIKKLKEIQKEHGDIESCYLVGDGYYDTNIMEFNVFDQVLYIE